uniref:Protein MEMO1 n=1 Tax=Petromyzon marinus TaxID=7757 RepID=A0AAJ7SS10_PETMA|nr:protein MEMO1 isoform X3 [Petromyzon marinus]
MTPSGLSTRLDWHAGYSYCGSCAAHAYTQVDPAQTKRVFILGPSHHVHLSGCALSSVSIYKTPIYNLRIDQKIYSELSQTGMFEKMSVEVDEDEHSIEMHLPYIAKVMESRRDDFTIVPVLVGSLNESRECEYGRLFSKYLDDPSNLFVFSSDFCHWGQRFRYTYYDESQGEIHKSIEYIDKMGMDIIEQLDPAAFSSYLKKYRNTICGRHPIGVMLNVRAIPLTHPYLFSDVQSSCACASLAQRTVVASLCHCCHAMNEPRCR